MAVRRRKRDPRYSRTIGTKPHVGRRYVVNGKVRIEWKDAEGKRRSRTIGVNGAETRKQADAELEEILMQLQRVTTDAPLEAKGAMAPVGRALRRYATYILDAADQLYDWISSAVQELSKTAGATDEEAVEETAASEAAGQETPEHEAE